MILPDQIEKWPISRLAPYANNARTHTAEQVEQVAASIVEFGWTVPILVDASGEVIAGHGRLMAAQRLGLDEVPVVQMSHLTPAQVRAYRIADNRLAELAGWDQKLLAVELVELRNLNFDMDLTGFSGLDLDRLLALDDDAGGGGDDFVPEPPADPITRAGDMWLLGDHRLLCGDATSATDVERLLGGAHPHLMITDPPYGVEYDANWRNEAERANGKKIGGSTIGKVRNDDRADWRDAWALFPGDVAYVWHAAGALQVTVYESLVECGFEIRMQIIWAKSQLVIGRGHYHLKHEPCWYAVRKGKTGHWQGDRTQATVWEIDKPSKSETGHSTQKPVECMLRPIRNNSARGDAVYEPFAGSGTTLIAAEQSGRRCLAMEIDPAYCDVIVKRWETATGRQATLEAHV